MRGFVFVCVCVVLVLVFVFVCVCVCALSGSGVAGAHHNCLPRGGAAGSRRTAAEAGCGRACRDAVRRGASARRPEVQGLGTRGGRMRLFVRVRCR